VLEEEIIQLRSDNQILLEKQNEHVRMIKGLKEEVEDSTNKSKVKNEGVLVG